MPRASVTTNSQEAAFDVPGPGIGHVVAYDLDGRILQEFGDRGRLSSPWGLAIAPANFGPLGNALLVANFGEGTIAAFDPQTGVFRDYARDPAGTPIRIDGIWGLAFGNGVSLGDADSLYFTAGPDHYTHGLFGSLRIARNISVTPSVDDHGRAELSIDSRADKSDVSITGDLKAHTTTIVTDEKPNWVIDRTSLIRGMPFMAFSTGIVMNCSTSSGPSAGALVRAITWTLVMSGTASIGRLSSE